MYEGEKNAEKGKRFPGVLRVAIDHLTLLRIEVIGLMYVLVCVVCVYCVLLQGTNTILTDKNKVV